MPLFRRPDGKVVKNESLVRRMIPYLMRGRNESAIYHDEVIDIAKIKPWLREYNRAHPDNPATLFHVFLWAIGRGFNSRPGLNRFVSGGRIYQRNSVSLSFAAKKKFDEGSPLVTVKLEFPADESFVDCLQRIKSELGEGRTNDNRSVDKELKLAMSLPGVVLRAVMAILRGLDRVNLLPGFMIKTDPMYCTAFVANLGSVGIDRTYHHLYEYGNASLFCVIGTPKKIPVVGANDQISVKEVVEMRWTFDERINDGFYCALALRQYVRLLEDPDRYFGSPTTQKETPKAPTESKPDVPANSSVTDAKGDKDQSGTLPN